MQKKALWIVIIVIIVVAGASAYLLMHKSSSKTNTGTTSSQSSTSSGSSSVSNAVLKTVSDSSLGQYLADASGHPLYTYGGDSSGTSNCTGSCVASWPAYEGESMADLPANVSMITRSDDGKMQYTYKGMPLYTFVADSGGKATGNGVNNFSLARP